MEELQADVRVLQAALQHAKERIDRSEDELKRIETTSDLLAEHKLRLLASTLSQEIRDKFWDSLRRGLLVGAVFAGVATAGGLWTASDILKNRVEAAVEGKQAEIASLRRGIVEALVDTKVQAEIANKEVDQLKKRVADATNDVSLLRKQVSSEAERAVLSIGVDVKSVAAKLEKYQVALSETQKRVDSAQLQADRAQATLTGQLQGLQSALATTQQQSAQTALLVARLDVKAAQEGLTKLFGTTISADGFLGVQTRQFIRRFQEKVGLPATGELDLATSEAIAKEAAQVN